MLRIILTSAVLAGSIGGAIFTTNESTHKTFPLDTVSIDKALAPPQMDLKDDTEQNNKADNDLYQLKLALGKCYSTAREINNYQAHLVMQEFLNGELGDEQQINIYMSHDPMKVLLKWDQTGKIVQYIDGENEGCMLVKLPGLLGRFSKVMKLELDSDLAKNDCRHSIKEIGLLNLVQQVMQAPYLEDGSNCKCNIRHESTPELTKFIINIDQPAENNSISKTILYINEHNLLIGIENYGNTNGQEQLLERYHYHQLKKLEQHDPATFTTLKF